MADFFKIINKKTDSSINRRFFTGSICNFNPLKVSLLFYVLTIWKIHLEVLRMETKIQKKEEFLT